MSDKFNLPWESMGGEIFNSKGQPILENSLEYESGDIFDLVEFAVTAINSHEAMREAFICYMAQFGRCIESHGFALTPAQEKAHKKAIAALALSEVK